MAEATWAAGKAHTPPSERGADGKRHLSSIDGALREQQDLSAVERFARLHDAGELPEDTDVYKSPIPLDRPRNGEQYAFEVDLDQCTGCKACVTACHRLNGLEEGETWRFVGLLHGGSTGEPVQKTVTSSCHHCVDPACLNGCPVNAYEKDPITGIVRHLDDQCIGCQYCMFTCPYEVPQLSADKGIVRKCDMCSDRLADGEAPACVQACPNDAIAIRIVDQGKVVEDAQTESFLPGAPSPSITLPATTYKTKEALPRNMLPADFFSVHKAHPHLPLAVMLTLTQLSVGAFFIDQLLPALFDPGTLASFRPFHGLVALSLGVLALVASVAHLGRPLYAWRAFIGLRTSWLSREIVAFGLYAKLAALYALALWQAEHPAVLSGVPELTQWASAAAPPLGVVVCATGVLGVVCSVMVYGVTERAWWSVSRTGFKFAGTAVVLGLATALVTGTGGLHLGAMPFAPGVPGAARAGACALAGATALKLLGEAGALWHLRDHRYGDLKRSAILLVGELRGMALGRLVCGVLGGIVIPLLAFGSLEAASVSVAFAASVVGLLALIGGELLERAMFFAAVASPRMPGGMP